MDSDTQEWMKQIKRHGDHCVSAVSSNSKAQFAGPMGRLQRRLEFAFEMFNREMTELYRSE